MSDAGSPAPGQHSDPTPSAMPLKSVSRERVGCFGSATGVVLGVLGVVILLAGGGALIVFGADGNDDVVSIDSGVAGAESGTPGGDGVLGEGEAATAADQGGSASELDDVVSCTRIDEGTVAIEVVNTTPETSSYFLTIGFFDDAGQRLADDSSVVNYLRPGERSIEQHLVFETPGTRCEVVEVDRYPAESIAGEVGEVGEIDEVGQCEVGAEPDLFGSFQASLSVTNSTPEASDYAIDVAFVDSQGIRRGIGSAFVEAVQPGETAPSEVFSTAKYSEGHTCEVVGVTRNAS